jgi:hypothetical protein
MNIYDYDNNPTVRGSTIREGVPHYAHPIVRTHPDTGRKALFVNRLMTDHILDMPRSESDWLLGFLFDHQEQRRFVYEHVWSPGDLMLWDNRCSLHARTISTRVSRACFAASLSSERSRSRGLTRRTGPGATLGQGHGRARIHRSSNVDGWTTGRAVGAPARGEQHLGRIHLPTR